MILDNKTKKYFKIICLVLFVDSPELMYSKS